MRRVRAQYSVDGGDHWQEAKPAEGFPTVDLATQPYSTITDQNRHLFVWDVVGSGFYGQSQNVILRLEGIPSVKPIKGSISGPFQRVVVSTQSMPFRVRGNQVHVTNGSDPVPNALVYRLAQHQTTADAMRAGTEAFHTDTEGYLQGRGVIDEDDRLVALAPIKSEFATDGRIALDDVDDWMDLGARGSLDISDSLSIEAWVKVDERNGSRFIVAYGSTT